MTNVTQTNVEGTIIGWTNIKNTSENLVFVNLGCVEVGFVIIVLQTQI